MFVLLLQSAMLDLVDIFDPSSEVPPLPPDPWNSAQPVCDITSDPWGSVGGWIMMSTCIKASQILELSSLCCFSHSEHQHSEQIKNSSCLLHYTQTKTLLVYTAVHSSTPVSGSPWRGPPSSSKSPNPWAPCANSCTDPWEAAPNSSPVNHAWDSPSGGGILTVPNKHNVCILLPISLYTSALNLSCRGRWDRSFCCTGGGEASTGGSSSVLSPTCQSYR